MPRRSRAWIWVGRAVAAAAVIGLAGYLYAAGLGKADELAGVIGVFLALAALVAPYLLPVPPPRSPQPVPPEVRCHRRVLVVTASSSSPTTTVWPRGRSTT